MKTRSLLIAFACVIIAFSVTVFSRQFKREPGLINVAASIPSQDPEEDCPLDPLVEALLKEPAKNDPNHKSEFFLALQTLGEKYGMSAREYCDEGLFSPDEGYAVRIRAGSEQHVVAIIRG